MPGSGYNEYSPCPGNIQGRGKQGLVYDLLHALIRDACVRYLIFPTVLHSVPRSRKGMLIRLSRSLILLESEILLASGIDTRFARVGHER